MKQTIEDFIKQKKSDSPMLSGKIDETMALIVSELIFEYLELCLSDVSETFDSSIDDKMLIHEIKNKFYRAVNNYR